MTLTPSGKRKMILDVDTGIDDALALAYLVSFDDVEILGVIGTYGNVSADTPYATRLMYWNGWGSGTFR